MKPYLQSHSKIKLRSCLYFLISLIGFNSLAQTTFTWDSGPSIDDTGQINPATSTISGQSLRIVTDDAAGLFHTSGFGVQKTGTSGVYIISGSGSDILTITFDSDNDGTFGDAFTLNSLISGEFGTGTGTIIRLRPNGNDANGENFADDNASAYQTFTPTNAANFTNITSLDILNGNSSGTFIIIEDISVSAGSSNDTPTVTAPTAPSGVLEDATNVTLADNIHVGDSDGDDQTLTFTITGGTLTIDNSGSVGGGITYGGSGNGSSGFTAQGTLSNLNAALDDAVFNPTANLNGTDVATVSFTANDGQATSTAAAVTFSIGAVNDVPSFALPGSPNQSVSEDAGAQSVSSFASSISTGGGSDESSQSLTFNVSTDNDALFSALPAINSSTGNLTYTPAANVNGLATITVNLSDDGGGTDTSGDQTFTITVSAVNDVPSFDLPGSPNQSVSEDAGAQAVNSFASSISKGGGSDESSQSLTFNVSTDNDALFSALPAINSSTGNLTYTPAANANGSATITVSLSDDGGGTDTSGDQTFTITVNAVNDVPSFALPGSPNQSVSEDAGAQSVSSFASSISTGGGSDESSQSLIFNVSTDNDALFSSLPAINSSTGNLTYTPAANVNGSATITVSLSDDGGGTDTSGDQTFTITVNAVNDAPSFALPGSPNQSVSEDAGAQTVSSFASSISTGGGSDESSQSLTFNVSTDNDALFSALPAINSSTGNLTYTPAANVNGLATITVNLSDDGGGTDTSGDQTFTITVSAVNDVPSFDLPGSPNQSVSEDAGAQAVNSFASSISKGGGSDESSQSLTFNVSTDNDALFSALPAINSSTGNLTYTPAANANGSATITVSLSDDGGGTDTSGDQTFTITVNAVNDVPSFALPGSPNQSVSEDAGAQSVSSFASSISTGGGSDESSQSLIFNVSTDNDALFSSLPAINSSTGNLTYTPGANANGSVTITVNLSDDGGGTDTSGDQTFTITVNAVNDVPSFALPGSPNQSVSEDADAQSVSSFASSISTGGGSHESSQSLTFNVSTDNDALFSALPAINSSTGNLTYTPAANVNGSATITVNLSDDGGGTDTSGDQTFTITVSAVNDAPSFALPGSPNQSITEGEGAQTLSSFATLISTGGGSDESSQSLTFNVSTDNDALFSALPAINSSTGDLTYTPTANVNGSATITVSLSDNGGGTNTSDNQQFTITVNAVNVPPSFTLSSSPHQSVNEDSGEHTISSFATSISPGGLNESSQSLSFNVSTSNDALFSALPTINPSTGNLTYTPADNVNGSANITISLSDDGGGTDTSGDEVFTITVNAVNDAPSFALSVSSNQSVSEDAGTQTVSSFASSISTGGGSDESSQALTFNVSTNNDALFSALPAIDSSTGDLTYTAEANANGSATITVSLSDDGGGTDTSGDQIFTITVNAVNDAPSFILPGNPNQSVDEDAGVQTVSSFVTSISTGGGLDESSQSLTFNVMNDNNELFSAQPSIDQNGTLSFTPATDVAGSATVTIVLNDDGGIAYEGEDTSQEQVFLITVTSINDAPTIIAPISDLQLDQGFEGLNVDLNTVFGDIEGDVLVFTASSYNEEVVLAEVSNDTLTLTEVGIGSALITVSASDGESSMTLNFDVVVSDPLSIQDIRMEVYPNPASEIVFLSSNSAIESVHAFDLNGRKLDCVLEHVNDLTSVALPSESNGGIILRIATRNGVVSRKIIKTE